MPMTATPPPTPPVPPSAPTPSAPPMPPVDMLRPVAHLQLKAAALLLFTLVVALMSLFLPGRDDEMLRNNPALYLDVQSWFMLG
mgnify:CR=1 FL=1